MKKCIILDLDNTLWGGIVGEDGIENLKLSLTSPGNSFVAFQQAILDQYNKGIILAINSRNNANDVWEVIRNHPNMILKEEHFAAFRINWNDKASNILELAEELNIGLDSMVFLDDDPINRSLVQSLIPEVEVPELPADPAEYTRFFNSLNYFDTSVITDEDKMRGNLYVTERLRREEEKRFDSKEDFLKSLSLELFVYRDNASCVPRLSQLTGKTNQFNTFKKELAEDQIYACIQSEDHVVYHARLEDKFGDHGVVIFALVTKKDNIWKIESMLMSCRVFGRAVEEAFFSVLSQDARNEGVERIDILYKETKKNIPAKEFIDKHFKEFTYKIPEVISSPEWININI